jgi:hypothetical protein
MILATGSRAFALPAAASERRVLSRAGCVAAENEYSLDAARPMIRTKSVYAIEVCYDNSGPGHYVRKFQFGNLAPDLDPDALTQTLRETIARREWKNSLNRVKIAEQIRPRFDRTRIWPELIRMYRRTAER